jgi:hypothetical protein
LRRGVIRAGLIAAPAISGFLVAPTKKSTPAPQREESEGERRSAAEAEILAEDHRNDCVPRQNAHRWPDRQQDAEDRE